MINLLYTTQPYNAIVVPKEKITFDAHWDKQDDGYSTNYDGARASITKYMNHLCIIGNKIENNQAHMNIYYDEHSKKSIDISTVVSEFNKEILISTLDDISRSTYTIDIEKTSNSPETTNKILHISYLYYLNDKTITAHKNSITINAKDINPLPTGWTQLNNKLDSETKDSSITINSIQFSQFWISGDIDPNSGNIDVYIDDVLQDSISLYNEKHIENALFYASSKSKKITEHKVTIKNHDNRKVNIYQIHYNPYSDYDKSYDEINGLINITCDEFNYVGFAQCNNNENANGGSYTGDIGHKLSYTFNGSRIHVVSFDQDNSFAGGEMKISLDGKDQGRYKPITRIGKFPIVFSSDYFPFGEHTIEIEHVANRGKTFHINSLLVDPLPKVGGHILGFNDIIKNDGNWVLDDTSTTPYFKTSTSGARLVFKFHGTRFWITGIRDDNYGTCSLTIDGDSSITLNGRKGIDKFYDNTNKIDLKRKANGNQGVLFYESKCS